jgi:hypothetical protein
MHFSVADLVCTPSILELRKAYLAGHTTPLAVLDRIKERERKLAKFGYFCQLTYALADKHAEAATKLFKQ